MQSRNSIVNKFNYRDTLRHSGKKHRSAASDRDNDTDELFLLSFNKNAVFEYGVAMGESILVESPFSPETPVLKMEVHAFERNGRVMLKDKQGFFHLADLIPGVPITTLDKPRFALAFSAESKIPQGFSFKEHAVKAFAA